MNQLKMNKTKISKMMSYVLRHHPEEHNIVLDEYGWASVDDILNLIKSDINTLEEIVNENNKKRFRFNEDKTLIKANQGHSIDIKNDMTVVIPKHSLYHGTKEKYLDSILKDGLKPMERQHVHLSKDVETATIVANRRKGDSVILTINTKKMNEDNVTIYLSDNGVYLTDYIDPKYINS